jgi:hypothetical protein
MNGDSRETGKLTPDGKSRPTPASSPPTQPRRHPRRHGGALMGESSDDLSARMGRYFDTDATFDELAKEAHPLTQDAARYNARSAREKILKEEGFIPEQLVRYALRPFDTRWCYFTSVRPIWNEPRPNLWAQCWQNNRFLMTRPVGVAHPEGFPLFFTSILGDNDFLKGHAYYYPLRLKDSAPHKSARSKDKTATLLDEKTDQLSANLSPMARSYIAGLGLPDPDADAATAELIWMHALAIGYSHAYLSENADGIRQDWPRIPLPKEKAVLLASASLGRQVAALLDTETPVDDVTAGNIRADLKDIAVFPPRRQQSPPTSQAATLN